ncbi:CybS-domain-containing protein, partial [Trametes coccinea BRFM310]
AAIYRGTVNDPTPFPPPSKTHGSYHWAFERLLSAGLVPLTVAAFATSGTSYPILDGLLGVSLVMHSHIGFDCVLVDYLHPRKFPLLGPLSKWALRATTVGVLVGVYQFNTNDIGTSLPSLPGCSRTGARTLERTLTLTRTPYPGLTELIVKAWHA